MSQIWIERWNATDTELQWILKPLDGEAAVPLLFAEDVDAADAEALLLCSRDGDAETWLVLCIDADVVSLNGDVVRNGIRVLADRDEIRVAGRGRAFLSTERPARVEPFPGAEKRIDCPRCKEILEVGQAAVRCPNALCGRWFHMLPRRLCWEYAPTCLCQHPTAIGNGFRWTPEGL